MTKALTKKRDIADAKDVSWLEIMQHCLVNFLFGFTSSIVIISLTLGYWWLVLSTYYVFKSVEGKILNRNKYVSKIGKNVIFPIPSTLGFFLGWWISQIIINKYM